MAKNKNVCSWTSRGLFSCMPLTSSMHSFLQTRPHDTCQAGHSDLFTKSPWSLPNFCWNLPSFWILPSTWAALAAFMAQSGPSVSDPAKTSWQTSTASLASWTRWRNSTESRWTEWYSTLPWPSKRGPAKEPLTNSVPNSVTNSEHQLIAAILTGFVSSRRSSSEERRTALAKVANTRSTHPNNFGNGVPMFSDGNFAKTDSDEVWEQLSQDDSNVSQQTN